MHSPLHIYMQVLASKPMDPSQCLSILQPHLQAACAAAQMAYASSSSTADDGNSRELDLAAPSDTSLECESPRPPPGALSLGRSWGPEDVIGACRTTVLRGESDVIGPSLAIIGCHEASVYVLAPLQHVLMSCCVDCTVVVCSSSPSCLSVCTIWLRCLPLSSTCVLARGCLGVLWVPGSGGCVAVASMRC